MAASLVVGLPLVAGGYLLVAGLPPDGGWGMSSGGGWWGYLWWLVATSWWMVATSWWLVGDEFRRRGYLLVAASYSQPIQAGRRAGWSRFRAAGLVRAIQSFGNFCAVVSL